VLRRLYVPISFLKATVFVAGEDDGATLFFKVGRLLGNGGLLLRILKGLNSNYRSFWTKPHSSFLLRCKNYADTNYLQAKVVTESAFNETEVAMFASRSATVLVGPLLVMTSTCWPSGFSKAT